jgi:hypothetical protein
VELAEGEHDLRLELRREGRGGGGARPTAGIAGSPPLVTLWWEAKRPAAFASANRLPDVDVLYIERTPRIPFNPRDRTGTSGWPSPGQEMTYLAHVKNWGDKAVTIPYVWRLDGAPAARGTVTIGPGREARMPFRWNWEADDHELEFQAGPADPAAPPEVSLVNNSVSIRTNALLVGLWVEESFYNYFHEHQRSLNYGSNSFEDFAQRAIRRWNEDLARAVFPATPGGVQDRIALDKVVVVPDGSLPRDPASLPWSATETRAPAPSDRTVDLQWGFLADAVVAPHPAADVAAHPGIVAAPRPGDRWRVARGSEFDFPQTAIHEMSHARFLIDLYGLCLAQADLSLGRRAVVEVTGDDGAPAAGTPLMPYVSADKYVYHHTWNDIMNTTATFYGRQICDQYSAAAWNLKRQRRGPGNINPPPDLGVFLDRDLPRRNRVLLVDQRGAPLAGAEVEVFRATPSKADRWYPRVFDNTPDLRVTADGEGYVLLPRNPFVPAGHRLRGDTARGLIILKVRYQGELHFAFMEITDFNLAYWRGQTEDAFYLRQLDLGGGAPGAPTAASAAPAISPVPQGAWLASYFTDAGLRKPVASRREETIDLDGIPGGGPGVAAPSAPAPSALGVYWTGDFRFEPGLKFLDVEANGGVQVYVDGRLILDEWDNRALRTWSPTMFSWPHGTQAVPSRPEREYRLRRITVRFRSAWVVGAGGEDAPPRCTLKIRPQGPPAEVPLNWWRADYFDDGDFACYLYSNWETAIDLHKEPTTHSALPGHLRGVRYTGDWDFAGGTYVFTVKVAGSGARLWIDDRLAEVPDRPDQATVPPPETETTVTFERELPPGRHRILVECGGARAPYLLEVGWEIRAR